MTKKQKKMLYRILIAAALFLAAKFVPLPPLLSTLLYFIAYFTVGYDILHKAWKGICNRRVFDERDVAWIGSLTCLKKCGMSIQEMKEYLAMCLQGEASIPQRKEMLAQKQAALRETIRELQDSVAYIDWKQNFYDEVLSGKRPYESNLIPVE